MNPFERTGIVTPKRSVFDLSYRKKLTCDMGQLIPVMCDEMVPGDKFQVSTTAVIRFQPLVAPIMHEVNAFVHYFFVPYRLLWDGSGTDNWETFITGGVDGTVVPTLPTWSPTVNTLGSLWDFFGFPLGIVPAGALPLDFPRRAYNLVWNQYYRDENLQTEVSLANEAILLRNWEKDYFTSALPWQQRGTAPALPVTIGGTGSASWLGSNIVVGAGAGTLTVQNAADPKLYAGGLAQNATNALNFMNSNTVAMSAATATTFNVADLRLAFQVQKWMERNARAGVRYIEFLNAHFGVYPKDERLQRAEYVGGCRTPVIVSEVLKTGTTDATSAQGNMAGHGIGVQREFSGTYHAEEFGLMIGFMSVMPRSAYAQGIDRQWLRKSRLDFFFPEFANLSEQAILQAELYATASSPANTAVFGYQGRYDEMRVKKDLFVSKMRSGVPTSFAYWHLGRYFSSAPALNSTFIACDGTSADLKRIFAVTSEPGLLCEVGNIIRAVRPLPIMSNPGLIDHD